MLSDALADVVPADVLDALGAGGQVRSTCGGLLIKCRWNGQPFDCCKNFLPLQTETGLCYTINSLHNRYHS